LGITCDFLWRDLDLIFGDGMSYTRIVDEGLYWKKGRDGGLILDGDGMIERAYNQTHKRGEVRRGAETILSV
jgi:hypothetical protein